MAQAATDRDHSRRRRQATLEYSDTLLSRQAEMRQHGIPGEYDPEAIAALQRKAVDGDAEAPRLIGAYLNLWETLGNGVRFDILDLSFIDRGFGFRLVLVDDLYRPYIEHIRKRWNNPAVFGDLEWLAAKIRDRRGSSMVWIDDSGSSFDWNTVHLWPTARVHGALPTLRGPI